VLTGWRADLFPFLVQLERLAFQLLRVELI
jgi:hypothetical protein